MYGSDLPHRTCFFVLLANFGQLAHRAQAACADIHVFEGAVDFDTTALNVEHKTTARAVLRKWHIVAVHRLALTDIATTCCHE